MVSRDPVTAHYRREDMVASFQLDGEPVRGRIVRLGEGTLDPILKRHAYPDGIARVLGEALLLSVMVGMSLKFDGKLLVQAEGNGPVSMLVGECTSQGGLRGYARFDRDRWATLTAEHGERPPLPALFGDKAVLGLIIVHDDPSMHPYQGVVPLTADTLSACAQEYFERSEQVPSRLALGVGELTVPGSPPSWRGGGLMIQKVAADEARGDPEDIWNTAQILFETLDDSELIDPDLAPDRLLFRLFNEPGVRMETPAEIQDVCSCNEDRLRKTLTGMPDAALRDLVEPDGTLAVDCQFCGRNYTIPVEDVTDPTDA